MKSPTIAIIIKLNIKQFYDIDGITSRIENSFKIKEIMKIFKNEL